MLAILLARWAAYAVATGSPDASPACVAAEAVVAELWSQPRRPPLSAGLEVRFKSPAWSRASQLRQGGWNGPAPSEALLTRWESSPPSSAATCANVQAVGASMAIASPGEGAGDDARTSVGLPVIDEAGRQALVQVSTLRRPLGSSVYLYLLEKSAGRWKVVSRRMLAIS